MSEQDPEPIATSADEIVWMTTAGASEVYGISDRAIRKRIAAGKIDHRQADDGSYRVAVPSKVIADAGIELQATGDQDDDTRTPMVRRSVAVDLTPAMTLIADLTERHESQIAKVEREKQELAAAAAMWQERATHLQERLDETTTLLLEAGEIPKPWWKRLFGL